MPQLHDLRRDQRLQLAKGGDVVRIAAFVFLPELGVRHRRTPFFPPTLTRGPAK